MTAHKISVLGSFKKSYGDTFSSLRKDPRIYLPFLIFALIEVSSLIFLYLAPREPLRAAMGPFITTFWGERFLHYPENFILLPKLAGFARMVLSVLFGSILTGVAVAYLYKKPLAVALNKFANLIIIGFILTTVYYFTNKAIYVFLMKYFNAGHEKFLFIGPRWWLGAFSPAISQLLGLILQAIFVYAIPILISTEKKFIGAIAGSFMFFVRNFILTLLLLGVPMLLAIPLIVLNYNGAYLIVNFFPEIIVWVGVLGIIVNSLILDPLITFTTATLFLEKRGKQ